MHIYVDGKPAELDYTHDSLTDTIQTTVPLDHRTPHTRRAVQGHD